jgi:hypothetical protein
MILIIYINHHWTHTTEALRCFYGKNNRLFPPLLVIENPCLFSQSLAYVMELLPMSWRSSAAFIGLSSRILGAWRFCPTGLFRIRRCGPRDLLRGWRCCRLDSDYPAQFISSMNSRSITKKLAERAECWALKKMVSYNHPRRQAKVEDLLQG